LKLNKKIKNTFLFVFLLVFCSLMLLSQINPVKKHITLSYTNGFKIKYFFLRGTHYSKIICKIYSGEADSNTKYRGVAELAIRTIFKGCKGYSESSVKNKILSDGVIIHTNIDAEKIQIIFSLPTENLKDFLKCFTSCLTSPLLYTNEIKEEKRNLISEIIQAREEKITLLEKNMGYFLFGEKHPYGKVFSKKGVESITAEDVKEYYESKIVPINVELNIISSLPRETIKEGVLLHNWEKKPVFRYNAQNFNKQIDNVFIQTSDKKTYLALAGVLPGYFEVDKYGIDFFIHLINGYFGSRANIFFAKENISSPKSFFRIYKKHSIFSLIFEFDDTEINRVISAIKKFKQSLLENFPSDREIREGGLSSFLGKKYIEWQKIDKYYNEYTFFESFYKNKYFNLKDILLSLKVKSIKNLYKSFYATSTFIILGNQKVKNNLKGFYRFYSLNDF